MGRTLSDANDDKEDKSSGKGVNNESDSNTDTDLDEEEFIVEKILKMRTTKKGKVQCKKYPLVFFFFFKTNHYCVFPILFMKIYSNGKDSPMMKIHG